MSFLYSVVKNIFVAYVNLRRKKDDVWRAIMAFVQVYDSEASLQLL